MKKLLTIFALLLAFFAVGCASTGNKKMKEANQSSVASSIKKDVTTKAQVAAMWGAPDATSFTDSGNEIWKYYHIKSSAKGSSFIPIVGWFSSGVNYTKKELAIFFDDKGVVKNYTFAESQGEQSTGIVPQ